MKLSTVRTFRSHFSPLSSVTNFVFSLMSWCELCVAASICLLFVMCRIKLACRTGSCQLIQCDIEYNVLSLRGQDMKRKIVSTVSESSERRTLLQR